MKYSFYCKHCGFAFLSDSKSEVVKMREEHGHKTAFGMPRQDKAKICPMLPTGNGMIARPSLAEFIRYQEVTN